MKQVSLKAANQKKLELKKTAIANLSISEGKQRMLIGGNLVAVTTSGEIAETQCTNRPTTTTSVMIGGCDTTAIAI